MGAEERIEGLQHVRDGEVLGLADGLVEGAPKLPQHGLPVGSPAGDIVQLVFHVGGEVVLDVALEEAGQESGYQAAPVLGLEAALLKAHVFAVLKDGNDAGIGGRAADAQFLQPLDQARLAEARRRLGEMLFGRHLAGRHCLAFLDVGQDAVVVVGRGVVPALSIQPQETVEHHHRASGPQYRRTVPGAHVHRHLVEDGAFHLAGHGALPNQLVEAELVIIQALGHIARPAGDIGRADGLVRLLGVLGLGLVHAGRVRHVGGAVFAPDQVATRENRLARHVDGIGPHIGDQADGLAANVDAFVEPLRHLHGAFGAEVELARGLLLQGRSGERRRRVAARLLAFDLGDGEGGVADGLHRAGGRGLVAEGQLIQLDAVEMGQLGDQGLVGGGAECGLYGPVFIGAEGFDFRLPIANQAQRHRLYAARRAATGKLAPQDGRQGEADQVIKRAARQVGVDQFAVKLARIAHGLQHRAPGDFVEDDPFHIDSGQQVGLLQDLLDMPRDSLALAVRVGGEIKVVRALQRPGDLLDVLLGPGVDLPLHGEIVVGAHRAVLGRKVAHMAIAGQHDEVLAQVLVDGPGLGRRFDDDNFHGVWLYLFD